MEPIVRAHEAQIKPIRRLEELQTQPSQTYTALQTQRTGGQHAITRDCSLAADGCRRRPGFAVAVGGTGMVSRAAGSVGDRSDLPGLRQQRFEPWFAPNLLRETIPERARSVLMKACLL